MSHPIGILHPGAMGIAVAATLQNSGNPVYWASDGRSDASRQRAEAHTLTDAGSLAALCATCDLLVSVCPPHAAEAVADAVLAHGFRGTFLDANAIAPQKARRIGAKMAAAGNSFVDGGIIGIPPTDRNQTWLYLSGPTAPELTGRFSAGPLEVEVISAEIGHASALKMCFAANTKGTTALLALVVGAAEALGVRDALEKQWSRDGGDFVAVAHERIRRVAHTKAWRFAGEMEEMAETFGAVGLPAGFHTAAATIYHRIGHFKDAPTRPSLTAVLTALIEAEMPAESA